MVGGIPICVYSPDANMFRVVHAKGKSLSSGGFGIALPAAVIVDNQHGNCTKSDGTNVASKDLSDVQSHRTSSRSDHLFIEEALFLHERGLIQVYEGDSLLNSSRLYSMLEALHISLPIYLAYAHVRSQSFRVLRHTRPRPKQGTKRLATMDASHDDNDAVLPLIRHGLPPLLLTEKITIAFDVFQPNSQFKKSDPGIPDMYVAVTSFSLPSPTFEELQQLMGTCNGVPLRIATVSDSGAVVMFGVTDYGVTDLSKPTSSR